MSRQLSPGISFFFLNDPPPPEIYTLSLHDALPICISHICAQHLHVDGEWVDPTPGEKPGRVRQIGIEDKTIQRALDGFPPAPAKIAIGEMDLSTEIGRAHV